MDSSVDEEASVEEAAFEEAIIDTDDASERAFEAELQGRPIPP